MAMTVASTEEPILSRLDRLDNILRQVEDIRGCNRAASSPKNSCASTPSSGTLASTDGHLSSSLDVSPKRLEKHCRPIDYVMMETEVKGTLIDRLDHVEHRVVKLEEELEAEKKKMEEDRAEKKGHNKKGLKQLVKNLVKRKREAARHKTRSC